jgi:hypothetical protein
MNPRFSLPPPEQGISLNLATKPKQVDAWLARLPMANPVEATAELTDFLATCARLRLSPDRLEAVLDHVLPTAGHLVETLRERFLGDSLPLPPNRQRAAELCSSLMIEIGHVCKLIILGRHGKRFQLFAAKSVDKPLYILLLALKQAIEVSLDTHQSPPVGVWCDMHQAYAHALNSGLATVVPPGFGEGPSLQDIYKSALLYALADPFRIPREEMAGTKEIISNFGGLAELLPGNDASRHGSVFAIDEESDNPVIVLSREPQQFSRWQLLLNTTQLVKRLSLTASQHARDSKPALAKHAGSARDLAYLEMLHRLKSQWGGSVQRLGNRRSRFELAPYEVVFGLSAIHRLLAPKGHGMSFSPFGAELAPAECLLVNDSVGGLALSRDRPINFQLRIGEVAAVRQGRAEHWSIGIVRWFRATRGGKAIFGLQLLAPGATGVGMHIEDDGVTLNGLWLPATPSLRQGEMLLGPAGKLGVGTTLVFDDGMHGERRVHLEQLAEFTPSIEAYRFSG